MFFISRKRTECGDINIVRIYIFRDLFKFIFPFFRNWANGSDALNKINPFFIPLTSRILE